MWTIKRGLLIYLSYVGFFFTSLYVLSGFFSLQLLILFIGVYLSNIIIFLIFLGLLGLTLEKYMMHFTWATYEIGKTSTIAKLILLPMIFAIIYPLIAGFFYFTYPFNSTELIILIFKLNVIIFMILGLPVTVGISTKLLISKNLNEEFRKFVFAQVISGLIPLTLLFVLTFLAFGTETEFSVSQLPTTFVVQLPIILIGFFLILVLLPYIIGFQRAKKYHLLLLNKQEDWHNKLLNILDLPTHRLYAKKLNQFLTDLHDEINTFSSEDKGISIWIQIDQDLIPEELQDYQYIIQAYRESHGLDLRFKYLDRMNLLVEQVEEMIQDLAEKENEEEMVNAANVWAKAYHFRKDDLFKEIEKTKQTKYIGWAAIVAIITPIASVILSELGKFIWSIFLQSLA